LPAPDGPSTEDLIGRVERGLYVVGDKSWSIDMQRFNFQFTGQRFYRIEDGKLAGMLRDVAYQGNTVDFWNACDGLCGREEYFLGGSPECGQHTEEILLELGFDWEAIGGLKERGAIP